MEIESAKNFGHYRKERWEPSFASHFFAARNVSVV